MNVICKEIFTYKTDLKYYFYTQIQHRLTPNTNNFLESPNT